MKCVSALSTVRNTEAALADVVERAARDLGGEPADLALVFASEHHADALGRIAHAVREKGLGRHVLGCTGESIVGEDQEVEGSTALSLWALSCPGVELQPLRLTFDGEGFDGWTDPPARNPSTSFLVLGDPYSFPADQLLRRVNQEAPGLRVVGGVASAGHKPGSNRLVLDDAVFNEGAVGLIIDGALTLRTIVSQGCRPIGRPFIVTKVEGNILRELGRRPVLEVLREVFEGLEEDDQARVQQGLHVGRVINEYQETFRRGDFLVRNVLGADEAGGIAISDFVRVGQTVQFHIRDAESADEDLHGLLEAERRERPEARPRGALLFSCNGRGSRLFSTPNHDVGLIHEVLGPLPVAGFFAMGEIGPVGGQNFLHGFTASIVIFEEPS
jgi:small ligand-binding sensory domain FIST